MRPKRRTTNFPVRWQPYAELTAASPCGGESSIQTSLLGGGRRNGIVERNLLSQLKGEANQQVTNDRAEPSLALSLRVGSEKESQQRPPNGQRYAPAVQQQRPSLLPAGSSMPPQTCAPGSAPAGQLGLGSNSLQLPLGVDDRVAADLLRRVSEDLDRRVGLLRQELGAEVRKEVLRLHAVAAAAGVPLPAAFSAGLPQPQQPCGGAWRRCPGCGARLGTVALKPYEHLCLCGQCSADATRVCLHCSLTWTGAVEAASGGRGGDLPSWLWPWQKSCGLLVLD